MFVHIGGDECPKARWRDCPKCRAKIKTEGLHNEEELQSYFIKRIEGFVNSRGKRIIGWDEILEGGLAPNATVMSWRGTQGGIDAVKSGHDVVMTPTSNCYFDYGQALTGETDNTGALLTMESVYNYEPVPPGLSDDEAKHVLGSQGNVWTEWIPDASRAEYMAAPRMCALSEVVWTQKAVRNYDDFLKRMGRQYDRLTFADVNYRVPTPLVLGGSVTSFSDTLVSFSGVPSDSEIRFTLNGEEPNRESFRYTEPIKLGTSTVIKARTFLSNGRQSSVVTFDFNKLDSTLNGLMYSYRIPKDSTDRDPNLWVLGKSGIAYSVGLPENLETAGPFSVTFSGFLTIEKDGIYTFYLRADSGSILSVNRVELVNGGPPDPGWWRSGKIYLKAGKYPLMILDLEFDQWRGVALEFEGPGIERQTIPPRLFTRK
jgi:hexosaminidase